MKEVLIITGACGVGKSTMAKAWATLKQGAYIECDYFTEWICNDQFPHWTSEEEVFVVKLSAQLAISYLEYGMSVAIENVWSPQAMQSLTALIQEQINVPIKQVWLYCNSQENHRRDQSRIPENQMGARVDMVNRELRSYNWPATIHPLDTSNLGIQETLDQLIHLKSSNDDHDLHIS